MGQAAGGREPELLGQAAEHRARVCRLLHTIDPATEISPPDVFRVRRQRATPYLWSRQDIRRLLEQARGLRHPLRAASYEALFGLLAVSGMRVGEAIALGREDVDLDAGVITIRKAKLDRVRLVPLHPTRVSDIPCKRFW
jgi:integrase/recombinase XerD